MSLIASETRNKLRCTLCGEWKPRARFVTRSLGSSHYDYRCSVCRKKPYDVRTLKERAKKGFMTQERVEEVIAKQSATGRAQKQAALRMRYAKENAKSWDKLLRSAALFVKLLLAKPASSEEERAWTEKMGALLNAAHAEILARRYDEAANPSWLFWYDFDGYIARRVRTLVAEYPGDPENCPIKVM